jgi:hypothetical protein
MRRCFQGLGPDELGLGDAIAAVLRCQWRLVFLLGQPLWSAKGEISCKTEETGLGDKTLAGLLRQSAYEPAGLSRSHFVPPCFLGNG